MSTYQARLYIPTRGAKRPARLFLPYRPEKGPKANRLFLKRALPKRARFNLTPGYVWEFSLNHAMPLVPALLREYGVLELHNEYSETQVCDARCRSARGDLCECSCLGEHHGGRSGQADWDVQLQGTTLLSGNYVRVCRTLRLPAALRQPNRCDNRPKWSELKLDRKKVA